MSTMTIDHTNAAERALRFVEPLPGFDDEDSYTLSAIDEGGLLYSLRSVHQPGLRFVLTPADCFFDDYRPELAPVIAQTLGSEDAGDVELMLVLTIGSGLVEATANMRAPIVVSAATGRAMQVVLDDDALPMQRRLLPAS